MLTAIDYDAILDTVLLHFRIEDGKFLADLGENVVEVIKIVRKGNGNVFVTYIENGEEVTNLHYSYD